MKLDIDKCRSKWEGSWKRNINNIHYENKF